MSSVMAPMQAIVKDANYTRIVDETKKSIVYGLSELDFSNVGNAA